MSTGTKRQRKPSENGSFRNSGRLKSLGRAVARALGGQKKARIQPGVSNVPTPPSPELDPVGSSDFELDLGQLKDDLSEMTPYIETGPFELDIGRSRTSLTEQDADSFYAQDLMVSSARPNPSLHDQSPLNEAVEESSRIPPPQHCRNASEQSHYSYITKDSGYETEDPVNNSLPLPFHPKRVSSWKLRRCRQNGHDFPPFPYFGDPCTRCGVSLRNYFDYQDEHFPEGIESVQQKSFNDVTASSDRLDQASHQTLETSIEPCPYEQQQIISNEARDSDISLRKYDTESPELSEEVTSTSDISNDPPCSRSSSEASIDTDGAESGNDDEQLVLVIARHHLLQRLMQEFYSMLSSFMTETPQDSPGHSTESGQTTSQADNGKSSKKNATRNGKRSLEREDENVPEDDESEDRRKRTSRSGAGGGDDRLFACPFYKYDPRRYTCTNSTRTKYRTCAGPGFDSIVRLKQHLKRNHSAPIQCLRCWQIFPDQTALATHSRSENLCQVLPLEVVEGISPQKFDRMKKWGSTWNEIFTIIFPGAPLPQSCYHDFEQPQEPEGPPSPSSQALADFEAYARTELPRLVEATLEALIQAETEPLEERLKPLLVDIVRSCQSTLGHRWSMIKGPNLTLPTVEQQSTSGPVSHQASRGFSTEAGTINEAWGPFPDAPVAPAIVEASYQEPRLLGLEESSNTAAAFKKSQNLSKPAVRHQRASDSGYWSLTSDEICRCDQFLDFTFDTNNLEPAYFPSIKPSTSVNRQDYFTPITDPQSQDQRRGRCEFCGGLLQPASSAI